MRCKQAATEIKVNKRYHSNSMVLTNVYLPLPYLDGLEDLVTARLYPNRSEAIRMAIKDLLEDENALVYPKHKKTQR